MSIRKRYKQIQINANDPSDIFEINKLELAKAIVDGIAFGIRNKKKRVDFEKFLIKKIIFIKL